MATVILRHEGLPCLQCVKNRCPRSGPGYFLADAYNECLHLISADAVTAAATTSAHERIRWSATDPADS